MSMKKIETFGTYGWCFALILSASFCFGETADSTEPPKSPPAKATETPATDACQTDYYEAVEKATAEKRCCWSFSMSRTRQKPSARWKKGPSTIPKSQRS